MRIRETVTQHKQGLTLLLLVVVCLVSLGVSTDSLSLRPTEIGHSIVSVFQQAAFHVGDFFSRTVSSVRELSRLRTEYNALREQVSEYEQVQSDLEALQAENERLRAALDFSETLPRNTLAARVIARDPGNFFGGVTINRGRVHDLQRNMPIVASAGGGPGLVGRVVEVGTHTSIVMPITDVRSYVAARLERSRYEGLVNGRGTTSSLLVMQYVDKLAARQIATGDRVITSGMQSVFPEGIAIGTVRAIESTPYESSLQLELEPVVPFGRIEYVFVIMEEADR